MTENGISKIIVDCAFRIHKRFGPGLLESVYEKLMIHELTKMGLNIRNQVGVPIKYDDKIIDLGFRVDIIVENKVIIELKSVKEIAPVHKKQLLTYLKLSELKLGLLINFNVNLIKNGITRIVNNL
ncbi:MAG: GxxExxY protein [Armatimonadetes bacterium]|nr:GxxExxY protein [Armatimonadota bacterium]